MPVTITAGQTETTDQGFYRVPKRDLIIGLQLVLQRGDLQIAAKLPFARKLVEELEAVEVRISPAGNEQYARGLRGRDARRPGVRGGAGVLERAEGLPERATGE